MFGGLFGKVCGCRPFCWCSGLFELAALFPLQFFFLLRKIREGSQLQLYLCPAPDNPPSAAIYSVKGAPSAAQFVKITHSDCCHFGRGLVSGAFRVKWLQQDGWKGKMQMILNLFWKVVPPLAFLYHMIPFPFCPRALWCPIDLTIFPPWFFPSSLFFLIPIYQSVSLFLT